MMERSPMHTDSAIFQFHCARVRIKPTYLVIHCTVDAEERTQGGQAPHQLAQVWRGANQTEQDVGCDGTVCIIDLKCGN